MLQNKGIGSKMMEEERIEYERMRTRNIELETRQRHIDSILEIKEKELLKVSNIRHFLQVLLYLFVLKLADGRT